MQVDLPLLAQRIVAQIKQTSEFTNRSERVVVARYR